MTTQTWHADRDLLAAYVAGALDPVNGASVEQHLDRCAECRRVFELDVSKFETHQR